MQFLTTVLRFLAIILVAGFFIGGGVTHFTNAEFFVSIMPPYLPYHLELVWISGIFELLGAVGLLIPRTRLLAGYGLIALALAVFPANIHMAMNPELFPQAEPIMYYLRLPLQFILIGIIWFGIGKERAARKAG